MELKKLQINCGVCDATGLNEEHLAAFSAVRINCGGLLVTPESQKILLAHGVNTNTGHVITVPTGVELAVKNGSCTISADNIPAKPVALMVNGSLTIEPGAEKALAAYASIQVNGSVLRPASLGGGIQVNGSETVYPDGFTPVESPLMLDRVFALRAKGKRYFAETVVITDAKADGTALAESGTRFAAKQAVVAESLLEAAVSMLDDKAKIVAVPDGCAYVDSNAELTASLIRRYGKKLYIDGNLVVERDAGDALEELEYLHVDGTVLLPKDLEERFFAMGARCEKLVVYRGKLIRNKEEFTVTAALLEKEGFITIRNCDEIRLDPDVPPEMIGECLAIHGCDNVVCTPEQKPILEAVCEDVDEIGPERESADEEKPPEDPDTVRINCGSYKF